MTAQITRLWKVTDSEGRAVTSGTGYQYPLPKGARAGAWTPSVEPAVCVSGYHLTRAPEHWWAGGERRLWVAEGRGAMALEPGDKVAFESVRLVAEVTSEWPLLPVFPLFRALLMSSWRIANGPNAQWPDWADLSGANLSGANGYTLPSHYALDKQGFVVSK